MPTDAGAVTETAAHPRAPGAAAQRFTLQQRFTVPPDALWPYVADTDRINRAAGIAEAKGTYEAGEGGRVLIGRAKQLGFSLEWVEHPFEHVAGERLGVLREYRSGPLSWLRSVVELAPAEGGGTLLTQTLEAQPRSVMFMPVVAAEIGVRLKRAFQRVYRELQAWLATPEAERAGADPFAPAKALSSGQEQALERGVAAVLARGVDPYPVAVLEAALRHGDPMELGRLRPLELAWRAGVPGDEMIDAFLIAADVGLLKLRWELLCPHCRTAAQTLESPDELERAGRCEACAVAIGVDPAASVELVFSANPAVREAETATYCLGAPAHSPHVVAQQVVAAGERLALRLKLGAGVWAVTAGPAFVAELDVGEGAAEATVSLSASPAEPLALAANGQLLVIVNDTPQPRRVKVEAGLQRETALTAARAAARSLELQQRWGNGRHETDVLPPA